MLPKIIFVGGGSLGHIAPSLALAESLTAECHFVCQPKPLETDFLADHGFAYTTLKAPRLGLKFIWQAIPAYLAAKRILQTERPDLVFSKGGHVSVPLCLAAKQLGIPIILHESDTVMGRANAIVARLATHICTGFPNVCKRTNVTVTGNPIRAQVTKGDRATALKITGFSGNRPVLLVVGGSQGALSLNRAIYKHLEQLTRHCDIIHLTGFNKNELPQKSQLSNPHSYFALEFATTQLPHFYALSDLALSRASGNFMAELTANNIPMILVPLRGVGHDHQQHNAQWLKTQGAAAVLQSGDLDKLLLSTVADLISDPSARAHLAAKAQTLMPSQAALHIAKIVTKTLASNSTCS